LRARDFATERLEVGGVDTRLGVSLAGSFHRHEHEIGMVPAQIDR
jgi:hypothetical protein